MGGGRHRLSQGRRALGRGPAAVLRHAGQDGQLPARGVGQRVTEQASCPLDWRLFLPERWDDDAERRAACQVPQQVHHRPKWQLALDMVDELGTWGLVPPVLVADAGDGDVGEFRQGLDDRQIPYVVQVKGDTSAHPEQVHPTTAPYQGRGRRPRPRYRQRPCSLKQLALAAGQYAGVDLTWRRGSKGLQRSRFLALRVRPAGITLASPGRRPR